MTKSKYTEKEGSTQRYYFNLEFEWIRIEIRIKTLKANLIKIITCMIITYIIWTEHDINKTTDTSHGRNK